MTDLDPHVQAAIEEEQQLLDQAVQQAQAQHLLNRCIQLNADARRTAAETTDPEETP